MIKNNLWLFLIASVTAAFLLRNDASPAAATMSPSRVSPDVPASKSVASSISSGADVEFLRRVLQRHPKAEVSGVLWPKVLDGSVSIRWLTNPDADGRFSPMPVTDAGGRLVGLMGTLSVPVDLVDRARSRDLRAMAYLELVLLHEAIHYEQIASGRLQPSVFGRPLFSREDCDAGWKLEREAYERECRHARERHIESVIGPLCLASDPDAFDRALLPSLVDHRRDACPAFWANEIPK